MSEFKDFICNSKILEPRKITYGKWSVISTGFLDDERYIYVVKDGKTKICMRVDTNVSFGVCEIRYFNKIMPEFYRWLVGTCYFCRGNVFLYDSWEDVDVLMRKLVNYIRHAR